MLILFTIITGLSDRQSLTHSQERGKALTAERASLFEYDENK